MKKTLHLFSICLLLGGAPLALACDEPGDKPEIPDPNTAETAQMVKANNEVKAYVKAMEEYLGCAKISGGAKRRSLSDLEEFADSFNQAIRTFKSRNS